MKTLQDLRGQIDKDFTAQRALAQSEAENSAIAAISATWSGYLDLDQRLVDFAKGDPSVGFRSLPRRDARTDPHAAGPNGKGSGERRRQGFRGHRSQRRAGRAGAPRHRHHDHLAVVFCAGGGFSLWRGISRPMGALTRAMTALAHGERGIDIPGLELDNEIGEMARAAKVFKDEAQRGVRGWPPRRKRSAAPPTPSASAPRRSARRRIPSLPRRCKGSARR